MRVLILILTPLVLLFLGCNEESTSSSEDYNSTPGSSLIGTWCFYDPETQLSPGGGYEFLDESRVYELAGTSCTHISLGLYIATTNEITMTFSSYTISGTYSLSSWLYIYTSSTTYVLKPQLDFENGGDDGIQ